ncbi:MAG: hypothetical protein QN229_05560 [Desulfurococcaceae archaeon TW002]
MRMVIRIRLRSNDSRLLEAFHKATLPDDAYPPKNFTITHEVRGGEAVFSITYEGPTTPEAVRTATSASEEILRLYKILLEIIT